MSKWRFTATFVVWATLKQLYRKKDAKGGLSQQQLHSPVNLVKHFGYGKSCYDFSSGKCWEHTNQLSCSHLWKDVGHMFGGRNWLPGLVTGEQSWKAVQNQGGFLIWNFLSQKIFMVQVFIAERFWIMTKWPKWPTKSVMMFWITNTWAGTTEKPNNYQISALLM